MKLSIFTITLAVAALTPATQRTARDFYNEGVAKLREKELRAAEGAFRAAAQSNQDTIQPAAAYNLGHVRFAQGKETLKGEGNRDQLLDNSQAAEVLAEEAIKRAQGVVESEELNAIIGAYMQGRAARKQMRASRDESTRELDLIGAALERWRRSKGDFLSAAELDATNADATYNADIVEQHIAKLLEFEKKLKDQNEQAGKVREKLKELMKQLRGKIPKDMQRESDDEEDDDEEEEKKEDGKKDEPKPGQKQQQRIGGDRQVSPEMARWLKETMKRRTMSVQEGEGEGVRAGKETKPEQRKGKDW